MNLSLPSRWFGSACLALALMVPFGLQVGCGGGGGSSAPSTPARTLSSIVVAPADKTIAAGTQLQFQATGIYSDQTQADLTATATWASSNPAIATIDASGHATGVAAGSTTISATQGAIGSSAALTVTSATLVSITVSPAAKTIAAGTRLQFQATGIYSDQTRADLTATATWTSSNPAAATCAGTGLAQAVAAGSTTISATQGAISGSAALTVTSATLGSITVSPAAPSLAAGFSLPFTATGHYSDGSAQDLTAQATWASSNPAAATIDASGLAFGVAVGVSTISATQGTISGSTSLTVSAATLASISISPELPTLPAGFTLAFSATGLFSDGTKEDLTTQVAWGSSNPAAAIIDAAGVATGVGTGTTSISATQGTVHGTVTLTTTAPTLVQISVTPTLQSLPMGLDMRFSAEGLFSDSSKQDLSAVVTWTSSEPTVASVDATGLASGLAVGTSTIQAAYGSVSGASTVTVTAAVLSAISLDPPSPYLPLGTQQQMTAYGVFSDDSGQDLTTQVAWTSSTPSVASVDETGLVTTPAGSVAGTTTITATSGLVSGSAVVTVTAPTLVSVQLFGVSPIMSGTTTPFTATAVYSDGSNPDVTAQAVWSSSDTSVAVVDNAPEHAGTVTAVGAGTTTLSASFGGVAGTASLTVNAAPLASIAVTPAGQTIAAPSRVQFTATGTFGDGSTQDLTAQATWSSSTATVAAISNAPGTEGLATGVRAGTTTISAAVGGITGTTTLTVTQATLVSVAVTPANPTLNKGLTLPMTATGRYSDGSTQDLTAVATWSSSRTNVASVSNLPGAKGTVTGLASGTATITASFNGVKNSTLVTVVNRTLQTITITPADSTVNRRSTVRFDATGHYSDGSSSKITGSVTWSSSNPAIASINPGKQGGAGKCYARSAGTVTITATMPSRTGAPPVSGTTTLTVR